ncbi:MAG: AAA family ATPase [Hyphomicrobiaceae bacterium]|nr:AAA family ATPase [Hyphomicrobiaceae bacterium]
MSRPSATESISEHQSDASVDTPQEGAARLDRARPIPRISIQAFCEDNSTTDVLQVAAEDRRLAKTHVSIHMGGAEAAVAHYRENPTPNLIIIESTLPRDELVAELDRLAECCDAGTRVLVIGHLNDVVLYREVLKRGVSEYLVAPVSPLQLMEALSNIYNDPNSAPVGNVIAFIGAKGGVGSSTICHNTAWMLSEHLKANVVVADLDLAFGTTGLDFNQDPVQGIAEALQSPERLDEVLLDRLLTKCSQHLSIFAAPVVLDRDYEISPDACDVVLDVVRQQVPYVAVDLPHVWTPWVKRVLLQADEVVITAAPDLANLRNAKNIMDLVKSARNNDAPPRLVLNTVGMPKRPEIAVKEFAQALGIDPIQVIEFDSENFGQAANNGQMIAEFSTKAKSSAQFREMAMLLAHRREMKASKPVKQSVGGLTPLLQKLKLKR